MSTALRVLAECVDLRNNKRYFPGDTFDPPPTEEQARRLHKAGCLSEAAIGFAQAESELKAAEKAAADKAAADKAAADKAGADKAANDKAAADKAAAEKAAADKAAADKADKK